MGVRRSLVSKAFSPLCALGLIGLSGTAEAESSDIRSAKTLYEFCTGDSLERVGCIAFINGFLTGSEASWAELDRVTEGTSRPVRYDDIRYFCPPEGSRATELADAFVTLFRKRPELQKHESRLLLVIVLRENWPCGQSPRR